MATPRCLNCDRPLGEADRFCPECGIHPLGEGAMPDGTPIAAINVRCLENVDFSGLPVKHFDGRSL